MPDPVKVTLKTFLKTDYRMKKIGTLIIEKPSDMFQISITELFMLIAIVNAVDIMIRIQKTSRRLKMHSSRKDSLESWLWLRLNMNRLRQTLAQQQSDLKYFLNWYEVSRSHYPLSNEMRDFMNFVTGSWWGEAAAQVVSSPRWWSASEGQSAASLSSAWASCFTRITRWAGQEHWEDGQQDSPLNLIKRWSLGRVQSWWTIDCQFIWVLLTHPLLIIIYLSPFNPSSLDYWLTNINYLLTHPLLIIC